MKKTSFQFIKRDLTLGIVVSSLVFVAALAWGGPFLATSRPAASAAGTAVQASAPTATLTGTLTHDGNVVFLNGSDGKRYKLENLQLPRSVEGKLVSVTGQVDSQAKLIRVDRIEAVTA